MSVNIKKPRTTAARLKTFNHTDMIESSKYKKKIISPVDKRQIRSTGMIPVISSFISAVGANKRDLYISYHGKNNNIYQYKGKGKHFTSIVKAGSIGRTVWRLVFKSLRRGGIKVGQFDFKNTTRSKDYSLKSTQGKGSLTKNDNKRVEELYNIQQKSIEDESTAVKKRKTITREGKKNVKKGIQQFNKAYTGRKKPKIFKSIKTQRES